MRLGLICFCRFFFLVQTWASAAVSQREDQVQGHHFILWFVRWGWTEDSGGWVKLDSPLKYTLNLSSEENEMNFITCRQQRDSGSDSDEDGVHRKRIASDSESDGGRNRSGSEAESPRRSEGSGGDDSGSDRPVKKRRVQRQSDSEQSEDESKKSRSGSDDESQPGSPVAASEGGSDRASEAASDNEGSPRRSDNGSEPEGSHDDDSD